MKLPAILVLGMIPLSACAAGPSSTMVEQGYQRGALGVAAIERQDWTAAERGLTRLSGVRGDDPARLINLGKVYMETGRTSEALSVWRLALASDRHFMVETMGGRVVSTKVLAEQALAAHGRGLRSAAR